MPDTKHTQSESTLLDKLHVAWRALLIVGAGLPSTSIVPLPLTQLLTRRFRREELMKRLHLMPQWASFCLKYILKAELEVHGRENIPKDRRGYMFVSNHQSYIDILALMSALDTVSFLSKSLIRKIPVIGRAAYAGGTIFFDRNTPEERQRALEETLRMCRESTAVVVFPEGTRSEDGNLRPKIHPRAMKEAYRHGIKIIPVALHGTRNIVPKSMDRVTLGQRVSVRIAPPLDPADFPDADAYARAAWSEVARLHAQCKKDVGEA